MCVLSSALRCGIVLFETNVLVDLIVVEMWTFIFHFSPQMLEALNFTKLKNLEDVR